MKILIDKKSRESGQVAIEYIMIVVISVIVVTIFIKGFVSREKAAPGAIIKAWDGVIKKIEKDKTDEAP